MKFWKILPLLLTASAWLGCNKTLDTTPVLPVAGYPNPCLDILFLGYHNGPTATVKVRLLNGDGTAIFEDPAFNNNTNVAINMRDRPATTYYLESTFGSEVFTQPIIKIKQ